jgi:hypothetical protein
LSRGGKETQDRSHHCFAWKPNNAVCVTAGFNYYVLHADADAANPEELDAAKERVAARWNGWFQAVTKILRQQVEGKKLMEEEEE